MLFLMSWLSASTISHYQISAINANAITLDNDAIIETYFKEFITLQHWSVGDVVEIVLANEVTQHSHPVKIIDEHLVICPVFLLRNLTKNNEPIDVVLRHPPPNPNSETFSVVSIDLTNRVVTLNNGTSWAYSPNDQFDAEFWKVGDLIMIGALEVFPPSHYDAILLNTSKQRLIRAISN